MDNLWTDSTDQMTTSFSFSDNPTTTYSLSNKDTDIRNLLDQIIEKAELDDLEHKKRSLAEGQGEKAIGEGWMPFHLKRLKELMEK